MKTRRSAYLNHRGLMRWGWRLFLCLGALSLCVMPRATVAETSKVRLLNSGSQPGHYLEWNGTPMLLVGDSVTQGWMESGTNFDQEGYVDALASRGINVLMIWSYMGTSSTIQGDDVRIGYDAPEIWPWVGSPDDSSFDLTQLNQAYFDRLADLVAYAETKGIVVLICIHEGWTKSRFDGHPFNVSLGNGPLNERQEYMEFSDYNSEMPETYNASWNKYQKNQYFQERFCDKLIVELDGYSNVIYEMCNEGDWYDKWYDRTIRNAYEQHFLAFFRARCDNLLLTNTDHVPGDDPHNDSKVDVVTLHGDWTNRFSDFQSGFQTSPARPYLMSEPVPGWDGVNNTLATIRQSMWEVTMAGAGWVNQNDPSFGWDPYAAIVSQATVRNEAYDYAGHCACFFNDSGVGFSNMGPDGALSSTGICLAREGVEYAVYAPTGGNVTVDLSAAPGGSTFSVRWYNPRTGSFTSENDAQGGGVRNFSAPDGNDWVLHISKDLTSSDTDSDGMNDGWEIDNGLNYEDPSDATVDSDGDGFTNLTEHDGDTDPNDAKLHPYLVVAGLGEPASGWGEAFCGDYSQQRWLRVGWSAYNAANGETRMTTGDIDGDGKDEVIMGLGPVGGESGIPGGWFEILDDDWTRLGWGRVAWSVYNSANGETWPACGDVDGDGIDEIVMGLGSGAAGWLEVFDYDSGTVSHKGWARTCWNAYNTDDGQTRPACGDIDGDGKDEIILGLGYDGAGWFEILDDDGAGYAHLGWQRVMWDAYNGVNGETRPTCGDIDGDGLEEILIGLGSGGDGWFEAFDHDAGSTPHKTWIRIHWNSYQSANGETRPTCGDIDGDGTDEIVVGLGQGGGGYMEVFDDASAGYAHLAWSRVHWSSCNTANGETWPAVKK